MEALLHHAPVPMPAPAPRQQGAVIGASAALQQVSAVTVQKPPAGAGREQCPRCASWDTKFCYYNNYNTAQPRHFCRACRRYWTLGGSLRNVPVGGSTRKRPRPARRPTRAIAAALADASLSAGTAAGAATTPSSSLCGPFAGSPVPAPAAAAVAAQNVGLLRSLLLGSVPLLEGRLGLGQPAASTGASDDLAQLGVSTGTPLWPVAGMEGDRATETTWKSGGVFPPTTAMWQELAAATGAGMPQRLL